MRLERRENVSPLLAMALIVGAIVVAFLLSGIAIAWGGVSPLRAYTQIAIGSFGSRFAITETLVRSVPLIFTGLAAAVAFRARLWNIGADGQFFMGGLAVVLLGTGQLHLPGVILIPLLIFFAAVLGAILLILPTYMKTAFNADEVVTTLLLNFIVVLFVSMMLDGPLKDTMAMGWPRPTPVFAHAPLPKIMGRQRLHLGFVLSIIAAVVIFILSTRTKWGFEMNAVGMNPEGARFLGLPVTRTLLLVACISGGLAGMGGAIEVMGLRGSLTNDLSPGFGYTGIIVATLAGLNPLAVIPAAIFVAGIFVGSDAMSRVVGLSSFIAQVITALSLICMLCASLLTQYRIRA